MIIFESNYVPANLACDNSDRKSVLAFLFLWKKNKKKAVEGGSYLLSLFFLIFYLLYAPYPKEGDQKWALSPESTHPKISSGTEEEMAAPAEHQPC